MLKHFYNTKDEIPANLQGAYIEKGGKWTLDDLDASHPIVQKRDELLSKEATSKQAIATLTTEKTNLETKVSVLEAEKTQLAAKVLPEGMKAVSTAVAELGEEALRVGLSKTEIPTIKTEYTTLKTEKEAREKSDFFAEVAEAVEFNSKAFTALAVQQNLNIQKLIETVDGKQVEKFVVVEKNGDSEVKTSVRDWVEKSPAFSPFLASLQAQEDKGFSFGRQQPDKGNNANYYDNIRKEMDEAQKAKAKTVNVSLADAFNGVAAN